MFIETADELAWAHRRPTESRRLSWPAVVCVQLAYKVT